MSDLRESAGREIQPGEELAALPVMLQHSLIVLMHALDELPDAAVGHAIDVWRRTAYDLHDGSVVFVDVYQSLLALGVQVSLARQRKAMQFDSWLEVDDVR